MMQKYQMLQGKRITSRKIEIQRINKKKDGVKEFCF